MVFYKNTLLGNFSGLIFGNWINAVQKYQPPAAELKLVAKTTCRIYPTAHYKAQLYPSSGTISHIITRQGILLTIPKAKRLFGLETHDLHHHAPFNFGKWKKAKTTILLEGLNKRRH
ncbi:MAG: hypothetical protein MUC59_03205 [Saprospiraceae bacterium]|jgi:hypothetical protein|nr:hypothetical protein [Saprospiraceae bacterium]